jgi:hypothetical protein
MVTLPRCGLLDSQDVPDFCKGQSRPVVHHDDFPIILIELFQSLMYSHF